MSDSRKSSTTPTTQSTTTEPFTINGKRWTPVTDTTRPENYRLVCAELGKSLGFRSEAKRAEFIRTWTAVEDAIEALVIAVAVAS